jgi:4-hydroxy-2-oxoheptanedioate aldolase
VGSPRPNPIRERRDRGELALNAWTYLTDPAIVEIAALAGFDAITFDLEHFPLDLGDARGLITAAESAGISPCFRAPSADSPLILPLLEVGAQGILIPHADEQAAREAVRRIRYAPLGDRGALGFSRAAQLGEVPWAEHVRRANEDVALVVAIEHHAVVERIASIAALDGVDFVTVGAHDVAESLGIRGRDDGRLRALVERAAEDVRSAGGARMAMSVGNDALPLSVEEARAFGVGFLTLLPSLERLLLAQLKETVAGLRARADAVAPVA